MTLPERGSRENLSELMTLERITSDHFRNRRNQGNAYAGLFGGQIIAQALAAATATVEGRTVHSLHGYFHRAGSPNLLIEFHVDRIRDGARFSVRRVTASQQDKLLFTMDCSFRIPLSGFEHQETLQPSFEPEEGIDLAAVAALVRPDLSPFVLEYASLHPIDVRFSNEMELITGGAPPRRSYWVRDPSMTSIEDPVVHQLVLAYLSDFMLSGGALIPHTVPFPGPHVSVVSLDHAIWYHRPVRCDDWLLFDTVSPSAHGGVNLTQARVYDRSGRLGRTRVIADSKSMSSASAS